MFNFFATILIGAIATFGTIWGTYNYVPLDYLSYSLPTEKLGSTITTIQGTDTLKDSRSVINTNFSNLNADKIENSTTSVVAITTLSNLASIGTITTGVWNGTKIGVAYGGTGSTTLSLNQILLGNGTNGVTTTVGYGTSGQFLTSQGSLLPPNWTSSSLDLTAQNVWTGASTTFVNGISFGFSTTSFATTTRFFSNFASTTQLQATSLGVGYATATASSTELSNLAVNGYCSGCVRVATTTTKTALSTSGVTTATAVCPANTVPINAMWEFRDASSNISNQTDGTSDWIILRSVAYNSLTWTVSILCARPSAVCESGEVFHLSVYCAAGGRNY